MAWQTAVPFLDPETGLVIPAGAYLKINSTQFDHKAQTATVQCGLYVSKTAREAGLAPVETFQADFLASSSQVGNQYAQIKPFPGTPASSNPDNLIAQVYAVLPVHPALSVLLVGAVAG
ncbi:MAG: hypothetical protein P4L03_08345 [Terracidiphilus sp.]|nr:hypothetical protein [Terracidiphilus sp.]